MKKINLILILLVVFTNCKKPEQNLVTGVKTEVIMVTGTFITCKVAFDPQSIVNYTHGMFYSKDSTFKTGVFTAQDTSNLTNGSFEIKISTLTPATKYYLKPYFQLSQVLVFGPVVKVKTNPSGTPYVISDPILSVTYNSAIFGGKIYNINSSKILKKGIIHGFSSSLNLKDKITEVYTSGVVTYQKILTYLFPDRTYYYRAFAITTSKDTLLGNVVSFKTPSTSNFVVGNYYQGGVIFYIDNTGLHGLIANTTKLGNYTWGCSGTILGATNKSVGFGGSNTSIIVSNCAENGAAKICDNLSSSGYSDWYLPSYGELEILMSKLSMHCRNPDFPIPVTYWSSSENNSTAAESLSISDLNSVLMPGTKNKTNSLQVCAIRKF